MGIFEYLILLGIINIVFGFVWKWVFVLPAALLFTAIKFDRGMLLVKTFGAYLLVSLTALVTLLALQDIQGGWQNIVYPIIGAFVLFMGFASNAHEQQKEAQSSFDFQAMRQIERNAGFEVVLMFGSIVLFTLILILPIIATNPLNQWLFDVTFWAYELPVIGWLIGIGGILVMLNLVWHGFVITLMLGGQVWSKVRGGTKDDVDVSKKEAKDIS